MTDGVPFAGDSRWPCRWVGSGNSANCAVPDHGCVGRCRLRPVRFSRLGVDGFSCRSRGEHEGISRGRCAVSGTKCFAKAAEKWSGASRPSPVSIIQLPRCSRDEKMRPAPDGTELGEVEHGGFFARLAPDAWRSCRTNLNKRCWAWWPPTRRDEKGRPAGLANPFPLWPSGFVSGAGPAGRWPTRWWLLPKRDRLPFLHVHRTFGKLKRPNVRPLPA